MNKAPKKPETTNKNGEGLTEYKPGSAFPGVLGRTIAESTAAWPDPVRTKPGSPNVLFIVLDDTGFGQLGCYGSPMNTPSLNRFASNGLLYNNMHTTALCSPSRSCILTASSVSSEYMAPFPFTGAIHDIVIDVSGDLIVDQDAKMRGVMAHQ
jgi:hypothetical protein